jgi:hypothetical protein
VDQVLGKVQALMELQEIAEMAELLLQTVVQAVEETLGATQVMLELVQQES